MMARDIVSSLCIWVCMVTAGAPTAAAQGQGGRGADPSAPLDAAALERAAEALQQANRARELERAVNLQARGVAIGGSPAEFAVAGTDPMAGPVVRDAPYSGEAITTVTQTLGDGTRIEQSTTAKYFRDGAGRIRREQTIIGLGGLNPSREPQTVITVDPDPGDAVAYQLDPASRTARRVGRGAGAILGLNTFFISTVVRWNAAGGRGAVPQAANAQPPVEESLGSRQFEGVNAAGRRTTTTIPVGAIGNDRPIEITDERWQSPELGILVYSRQSDPRTGVVEYRLTNITRTEPPPDLFVVPSDYTVVGGGAGVRTGGPGLREGGAGRGAGGRGGRGQN